jgi:methylenetetrahydrofolate dehydrogenase (NADP+)/methenyltetrahydrofolate cyclohydrolase
MILDGKKHSQEIFEKIKQEVEGLPFTPLFCDILVGDDLASKKYVELKKKKARELGIDFYDANFDANILTEDLIEKINELNKVPNMCGIIVQLPLPAHIDTVKVLNAIEPKLDVDCLGSVSSQKFYDGDLSIAPPTALACLYLLDSINLDLNNKKIVIVGEGKLVGRPLANLLKYRNLNFEIINSKTFSKEEIVLSADVVISAVGKANMFNASSFKEGVVLIDAGTSEEEGSLVGDINFISVNEKASFLTPAKGGVGPLTIAMLFLNVLKVAKQKQNE